MKRLIDPGDQFVAERYYLKYLKMFENVSLIYLSIYLTNNYN